MTRPRSFQDEYPVTAFLLLFNLAFFALEFIVSTKGDADGLAGLARGIDGRALDRLGMLSPFRIDQGEYWRLISCTFLHASLLHLLCNGFTLFDFGRLIEPLLSRWRFVTVYAASGVGASLTSLFVSGVASVGASGALCGIFGALLSYSIRHREVLRESMTRVLFLLVIITMMPGVDWAAHAGGFAVGFAFGWFTSAYTTSTAAARWRYPGYIAAILMAASLIMALRNHFLGGAEF